MKSGVKQSATFNAPSAAVAEARAAIRSGAWTSHTSGLARDHVQGNVVILPRSYAEDFLRYCQRNPKPCPLLAVSEPGDAMLATLGADIDITGEYDITTRLFSESPSRIIISFDQALLGDIEEMIAVAGCPMTLLGNVGSDQLRINSDGEEIIQLDVTEIEKAWRSSLAGKLQAEAMAAGAE